MSTTQGRRWHLARIRELEATIRTHADSILSLQRERDTAVRLLREFYDAAEGDIPMRFYNVKSEVWKFLAERE